MPITRILPGPDCGHCLLVTRLWDAVCEARSKSDLIRNLRLAPDAVVILDYAWFDFNRVEELCILRDRYPCSGWMLFSETLVGSLLHCSLRGERPFGVVLKRCDSDEIEAAFEAVMQGRGYVCESIRDTPAYPNSPVRVGCLRTPYRPGCCIRLFRCLPYIR